MRKTSNKWGDPGHFVAIQQRGAVLIVSLVILLLLTIVGLTAMQSLTLEEKMVSNTQDATLAFHGAEAGLSHCEAIVQSVQAGRGEVYYYGSLQPDWHTDAAVWQSIGEEADFTGLQQNPRCASEYLGSAGADIDTQAFYTRDTPAARPVFRVTSISQGASTRTEAIHESLFICPGGCEDVRLTN